MPDPKKDTPHADEPIEPPTILSLKTSSFQSDRSDLPLPSNPDSAPPRVHISAPLNVKTTPGLNGSNNSTNSEPRVQMRRPLSDLNLAAKTSPPLAHSKTLSSNEADGDRVEIGLDGLPITPIQEPVHPRGQVRTGVSWAPKSRLNTLNPSPSLSPSPSPNPSNPPSNNPPNNPLTSESSLPKPKSKSQPSSPKSLSPPQPFAANPSTLPLSKSQDLSPTPPPSVSTQSNNPSTLPLSKPTPQPSIPAQSSNPSTLPLLKPTPPPSIPSQSNHPSAPPLSNPSSNLSNPSSKAFLEQRSHTIETLAEYPLLTLLSHPPLFIHSEVCTLE